MVWPSKSTPSSGGNVRVEARASQCEGSESKILRRRAEQKQHTIEQRLRYNLGRGNQELTGDLKLEV